LRWWVEEICDGDQSLHEQLSVEAARLAPAGSGLMALDWNNGNRTILVDPRLTGLILGQTLHTSRAEVYRALIEATAYGARAIVERLREYGVTVDRVVCCGGIAEKNDLFMQIYADVIGQPMLIAGSPQTPALGAALSAAVTAGADAGGYAGWEEAQDRMTSVKEKAFTPNPDARSTYDILYGIYRELHDTVGLPAEASAKAGGVANARPDLASIMKRLLALKEQKAVAGV
jgi:L-ribulokinase